MLQVMQAEPHPIDIQAAKAEGLRHRLLQQGGRIVAQQAQDADEHADAIPIWPAFAQARQDLLVDSRPVCAPAPHGDGVLKRRRTLLQKRKIMQWVKQILFPVVTARMGGDDALLMQDLNDKRIGPQGHVARRVVDGHRIAIGFKHHLAVGGERDEAFDATLHITRWQRAQPGL